MTENNDSPRVVWFMAGIAIGATVALLFAPASGEDTRRSIRRQAIRSRKRLMEAGSDLADRGRDLYDKGRQIADEAADMFERGKRMVQG